MSPIHNPSKTINTATAEQTQQCGSECCLKKLKAAKTEKSNSQLIESAQTLQWDPAVEMQALIAIQDTDGCSRHLHD